MTMVRLELKVDVIGRGQGLKIRLRVRTGKDGVAVRVNSKRKAEESGRNCID